MRSADSARYPKAFIAIGSGKMYWLKTLSVMTAGVFRKTALKARTASFRLASLSACSPLSAYSLISSWRASGSSSDVRWETRNFSSSAIRSSCVTAERARSRASRGGVVSGSAEGGGLFGLVLLGAEGFRLVVWVGGPEAPAATAIEEPMIARSANETTSLLVNPALFIRLRTSIPLVACSINEPRPICPSQLLPRPEPGRPCSTAARHPEAPQAWARCPTEHTRHCTGRPALQHRKR